MTAAAVPVSVLEDMARAHDVEEAGQGGEESAWDVGEREGVTYPCGVAEDFEEFKARRVEAMRCALDVFLRWRP